MTVAHRSLHFRLRRVRQQLQRPLYRLFHVLGRAVSRPRTTRPDPATLRRVLIVRHDRIGDWVVTSPVVAMLRELAPAAEVDVLASPLNAALVRADSRVTQVIVNDHGWVGWLRALRQLRARRYDLVISTIYGKSLREGFVAALASHRDTYSVSVHRPRRYQGFFSATQRVPPSWTHMSERLLYVAQRGVLGSTLERTEATARWPMHLGTDASAEGWAEAFLHENRIESFAAVNLSAAQLDREWSPAAAAVTLRLLLAAHADLTLVVTPPPGKEDDAAELVRRCDSPRVVSAPASPRLVDLVALLRRSRVVVTPDTANVHLASAVGRPVLGLFTPGPTSVLWAPRDVPFRIVVAHGRTVSDVVPGDVVSAFGELLAMT